ncbi:multiheme c-type cytochrome [Litorivivens sp.]|uniref:multiheme c-type cytochrome n=1 Tax=Litorivivens sp. TaxID=2020868 RepID=UPI003565113B
MAVGRLRYGWRGLVALGLQLLLCHAPALAKSECAGCHAEQVAQWQQSHHAKAMLPATKENVAAQFDGSATRYNGRDFRFVATAAGYQVQISIGESAEIYPVDYTFGVYPLQQYLARLPQGRYQALPVAWDTRPKEEGGQRWFALESDLDWDHPGFTWNTSCAECHSTRLEKNFDAQTRIFNTRFDEINVSCEACHGDSSGHLRWLESGQPNTGGAGFAASLGERGQWQWLEDSPIARRDSPPTGAQLSSCAQCHSRRQSVGKWHPQSPVFDHAMPTLITPPHYFADGQIRDEVFVLGSFLQSRMHAAGVVCSNCHEPHTAALRADGDGVCTQCHKAEEFAARKHHQHQPESVNCVDCHMPATTYMGVDPRRDHRFGVPDPEFSAALGSPDPCRTCHAKASAEFLSQRLPGLPGASAMQARHFARALTKTMSPGDLHRIDSGYFPPIREASLLSRLSPAAESEREVLLGKLAHDSPLVRAAAVRQLFPLAPAERWRLLQPMLSETNRAVRMELAPVLAGAVPDKVDAQTRKLLSRLFKEYETLMLANLDSPQMASNFANYRAAQGKDAETLALYRRAIELDSEFLYPYLQIAALRRDHADEREWLERARAVDPQSGEAAYQLGLYHIRQKDYGSALRELAQAADMAPRRSDFTYTYAVALENAGELDKAIAMLRRLESVGDASDRSRDLLLRYLLKAGREADAQALLQTWLAAEPTNTTAQTWARWLDNRP